jgi:hypothetical protein
MLNNFHFDYDNFYEKLLEASQKAFKDLLISHVDEHFYLFGLFTGTENMGIGIVGNSEEKLTELAQKLLANDRKERPELQLYAGLNLKEMRIYLRYGQGAEAYFDPFEYQALFAELNNSLVDRFQNLFDIWVATDEPNRLQLFEEEWAEVRKLEKVSCDVLRQLDSEYIFGDGKERERIYLTFMDGDLDCSNESYPDLNPKTVIERYLNEFEIAKGVNKIINKNREMRHDYILAKKKVKK